MNPYDFAELNLERRRNAAREHSGMRALDPRRAAHDQRVGHGRPGHEQHQQGGDLDRQHECGERSHREREGGARGRSHQRGTGTAPRAVLTAWSGP
jgi:hypothetical protein